VNERIDLAALLADPARVADASGEALRGLLIEVANERTRLDAVERGLLAQLLAERNGRDEDRLLTLEEASAILGVLPDWLRRQHMPFRVEVSAGQVRYSAHGLQRYIRARVTK
jgi:hypothetical protein